MMLKKKDDDDQIYEVDKGTILQEKRIFSQNPLDIRASQEVLIKIIRLMNSSCEFTNDEIVDLFFACSMLFQTKDVLLRRLMYIVLKELAPLAEGKIMIISSIMKDLSSKFASQRVCALRAISKVANDQIIPSYERYIRQGFVDKDPSIASAALVTA